VFICVHLWLNPGNEAMQTRRLGNSDLDVTPLGVGAWAMGGGGWAFAWGGQDDGDSVAAIRAAIDAGINWIDTAPVYGLGHAEEVVAKALDGLVNRPLVFTKCGRVWGADGQIGKSLKAASVRRECDDSLRRLRVERIDLYQMHWPEPIEDVEEGWTAMARLKDEGKVRWIGVSNFTAAQLERVRTIAPVTSLQPPYSLVNREIEDEVVPYCATQGIGLLVYSPMRNGLLSGSMTRQRIAALPADDWRKTKNPDFQEPLLSQNLRLVERLKAVAARHGRTAGEAAIAWTLRRPDVTSAVVGLRRADQVAGVVGAADWRLTEAEISEIEGPKQ
jgi:aryl-alcohol dehydrogenase-like predicted oxidoreductase